jgi:serine/threonine protein kinase
MSEPLESPEPLKAVGPKSAVAENEVRLRTYSERNSDDLTPSVDGMRFELVERSNEFDGFRLIETLGDGATATVYRALNQKTAETVAVKIFKQVSSSSSGNSIKGDDHSKFAQMKRFEKELSTLRKLDCSNIVSVSGWGTTPDGAPYLVMEYVSGRSIKNILDDGEVFPADRTISIAREICRALNSAHTLEFIHRDLKPSNIIVNDKNATKVVDFGIAKAMGIGIIDDTITQLGSVVGSPAYMSPEQCLGEPLDARSDIYSLGCTMYEMLTGFKAFASETTVQAIAKQINPDRTGVRKYLHSTGVSPGLESVIMRCLERFPENRYQRVGELDHDLSALQLKKPISVGSSSQGSSNRSVLLMVMSAVAVVLIGNIIWLNVRDVREVRDPGKTYVVPTLSTSHGSPLHGVQIFNNNGKMIFDDPAARDIKQALMDAAKERVDLREVKLQDANLSNITLIGVDLSGADLTGSRLTQSHLTDVKLHQANLKGAELGQVHLMNVDLSQADLSGANLTQCKAPGCNMSGANFSFARLTQSHLTQATCSNAIFRTAELIQTKFDGANLRFANFDNARLTQTSFDGADLSNASFANTNPTQVRIQGANLAGTFLPNIEIENNGTHLRRMRFH